MASKPYADFITVISTRKGDEMANTLKQRDMKNINLIEVLRIIKDKGLVTRKEVQKCSGLSWGGTSQIISNLMEKNLIINSKDSDVAVSGRKPEVLSLNNDDNFIIGLDINVSGIYAVIINLSSEIIYKTETEPIFDNKELFIKSIIKFIHSLMEKFSDKNFMGIGISMQGRVDEQNGISKEFIGISDWVDVPIEDILTKEFDIPVHIAHDPECLLTAFDSDEDSMLIRMDFGIGMAVKKNNSLISAEGMLEIGKTAVFDKNGNLIGKLSDYATITGIKKEYPLFFEDLSSCTKNNKKDNKSEEYAKVFENMSLFLGSVLANALILFDVKQLILCGKLTEYKCFFFDKMYEIIRKSCKNDIDVIFFDVKKAAYGAAEIVLDKKILNV